PLDPRRYSSSSLQTGMDRRTGGCERDCGAIGREGNPERIRSAEVVGRGQGPSRSEPRGRRLYQVERRAVPADPTDTGESPVLFLCRTATANGGGGSAAGWGPEPGQQL